MTHPGEPRARVGLEPDREADMVGVWIGLLAPAGAAEVLPVRRVRFYETGVAWFEREGQVAGGTSLPLPTSHLDDALKSLVILGGDVGVGAITFPTAAPARASRAAAGLEEDGALFGALGALVGTRVRARHLTDGVLEGVLLDVDGPLVLEDDPEPRYVLTLLASDGAVRWARTDALSAVEAVDPDVAERLAVAAGTLDATHAARERPLDVQLSRGGHLALGYLAEAPVWRVTYRIVSRPDGARLQAWALVHNDTGEDWDGVQVELANGEPDSFLYPLAAPRYLARDLHTPPRDLDDVAQLARTTVDDLWTGSGMGTGCGSGSFGSVGGGVAHGVAGEGVVLGRAANLKEAETVQTPTQFVYRVADRLDLPARHSALVPLVHQDIPTESVVVFEPSGSPPRTGVWLRNGTDRTLPEGVVSVLEAGGLAGEGHLERLKPEESQLLLFGNELDVDLERRSEVLAPSIEAVAFDGTSVRVTELQRTEHTVSVHNRGAAPRAVWMGLALPEEAEVEGERRTEVDPHRGFTWVALDGAPGASEERVEVARRGVEVRPPEAIEAATWRAWSEAGVGDADALERVADARQALAEVEADNDQLRGEIARAEGQLEGLRTDLRASDGGDGTQSLARKASNLEQELRRLRTRLEVGLADREGAFDGLIESLRGLATGV